MLPGTENALMSRGQDRALRQTTEAPGELGASGPAYELAKGLVGLKRSLRSAPTPVQGVGCLPGEGALFSNLHKSCRLLPRLRA